MNVSRMYTGDLKPDLEITIADPDSAVDLTTVPVRMIGKLDGEVVFDRAPTEKEVVGDTTVLRMEWETGDTAAPGYLGIEIEVAWPVGKPQTIRPGAVHLIGDYDLAEV